MDWSKDKQLQLIELYRIHECLWNPKHEDYKSRQSKTDSWKEIAQIIECDVDDVQRKIDSLLSSFRRIRRSREKSSWFAFKPLLFLMDKFKGQNPHEAEEYNEIVKIESEPIGKGESDDLLSSNEMTETMNVNKSPTNFPQKRKIEGKFRHAQSHKILRTETSERETKRDTSSVFGEYVAIKHRGYDTHTQHIVEHLINNILFQADIGKYETGKEQSLVDIELE
ncbi:hypothetical protein FQR65_LT11691 [Abscondita terminalis]|nr:hypothetical protein FQR65_LT11691 [Abscondita terminalis]